MNTDEMDAHPHLRTEIRLIGEALEREMPVLGICLGAQLLAVALGAGVRRNEEKEIGWYTVEPTPDGIRDSLFSHFGGPQQIFQWHGDTFEVPDGASHLASSSSCTNQAFRYGDSAYGVQFHLEVDERLIERWLHVPHHCAEIEALGGRIEPDEIRRSTVENIARSKKLAHDVFGSFIELFDLSGRSRALPSR